MGTKYIKSPLNYTGGKYKALEHIMSKFPRSMNRFVDLFCGGLNVGINVRAGEILANDHLTPLIGMYQMFQTTDVEVLLERIKQRIRQYGLTKTNALGYVALRDEYNRTRRPLDLFVLTCFAFNYQLRFNAEHEFNTSFGKDRSSFGDSMEKRLVEFCKELQSKNIRFTALDFESFDFSVLEEGDMMYCDPPYLLTTGPYNDGKRGFKDWTQAEDKALFDVLDSLNGRGIRFALSNVFMHQGQRNDALMEWSRKYEVSYLNSTYANCSYHKKDRGADTVEVLVTNYSC